MNDKELYEMKLLVQLEAWSVEIETLKAKVDLADSELRARERLVREKLAAIRARSDDAWEPLRADVVAAVNSLKQALRSMRSSI